MERQLISVREACARWSIGKTKLYQLLNAACIRAVKSGRSTLVDVHSGDRYFSALPAFRAA